jgi:hypothetical protein
MSATRFGGSAQAADPSGRGVRPALLDPFGVFTTNTQFRHPA